MRLFRTLLLVLAFLLLACTAEATQITVQQATIGGWQHPNTSPRLRIFLSKPVRTSDGVLLQSGSTQNGLFYQSITCSVAGGILTIPQLTVDSLTDARVGPDATYSAYLYTSGGQQIAQYSGFGKFTVAPAPTTTTWGDILEFNTAFVPHIDTITYNRTQIDAKIASITAGGVFAPKEAFYITQVPDPDLTNEQALSVLATGLLKSTTGTGLITIAVAETDYSSPLTFNSPLTRSVNAISIQQASGAQAGFLSSADWTTFNSKQAALGFTPENSANKNATNGYAGLSGGKLSLSQGQEVWSITDLTDYDGASGTGSTAIKATITGVSSGQGLTWNGSNWVNSTIATVSSVGLATNATWYTITGSPVTTTGNLTFNLTTGLSLNQVLGTGAAGVVGLRSLVNADLPVVDQAHGGGNPTTLGTAYQIVGVNSGATANQYLTLSAGSNITITPSGASLIIAAAAAANHNILSSTHLDTTADAVVRGDQMVGQGSGTPTWARKGIGAANSVWVSDGTDPNWGTINLSSSAAVSGTLGTARGGLGLDASATNNGAIPIKNGSGFSIAQVIAGSNITITPGAGTLQIDASGTLGAAWSDLTSPTAPLALSMSTHTTTFTWNAGTSSSDLVTLKDSTGNTSASGHVLVVQSVGTSTIKPILITAQGTLNGVEMSNAGMLAPIGTGGITANALVGVSGNGAIGRASAGNFVARTFTDAAGITWTNGDLVSGNPSAALNLATLVASQTMFDGSQATRTITFNLSGTDPVLTIGSSLFNFSTGTIQQGGVNVVLETRTLTGGTGINAIGDLSTNRTVSIDQGFSPTWTAPHIWTPGARNASAASYFTINIPADTNITASTESIGFKTVTATRTWATGALTTQRENVFAAPTYAFNATSTVTNAATVAITGAPIAGSNATLTNRHALWVQTGATTLGAQSVNFWIDSSPNAIINRFNDRIFVGGASTNDGKLTNTSSDWLETKIDGAVSNSQVGILNTIGLIGIVSGSRTSDFGGVTAGTIGMFPYALNDSTGNASSAYALYAEAEMTATSVGAATHAGEFEIVSKGTSPAITPFSLAPTGLTEGVRIGSGGSRSSVTAASNALSIINNGARFGKGIVFDAIGLTGTDGTGTGSAEALSLARGHQIVWRNSGGVYSTLDSDFFKPVSGYKILTDNFLFRDSGDTVTRLQFASNSWTFSTPTTVFESTTDFFPQLTIRAINSTAGAAGYVLYAKARAGVTAVQNGDTLGNMIWQGFSNAAYNNSSLITVTVDTAPSGSDVKSTISFQTGGSAMAERMQITSWGNIKVNGNANRGTTEGSGQIVIFNGTAPAGTLTNGVSLYSASGELRVMDAAGNSTLLSPHDDDTNEWVFYSRNTVTGKVLKIDMERMLKFLNAKFGTNFIHEFEDKEGTSR